MLISPTKRNKIILSDYNYRRDIENRLLMARLSTFEVQVLINLINGSLKTSVLHVSEDLETEEDLLIPVLDKLSATKLFQRQGGTILVDKEMRKYYESQILKFDENFEPGMEFLQSLLCKIPIHVLPVWYSISRASDNIFGSIVERFLLTPKIYERYLIDLNFEDPVLKGIVNEVFNSPDFKVHASDIMSKYDLSHECFEQYMLHLEYNFVCCLAYELENDIWEEVVTPFYEWREYLQFQKETVPSRIDDFDSIQRTHPHDFGFVKDMILVLKALQKKPMSATDIPALLPHVNMNCSYQNYVESLIDKLIMMQLVELKSKKLFPQESCKDWLEYPVQDLAMSVYRNLTMRNKLRDDKEMVLNERDARETERSLRRIIHYGWIYFEDFMKGFVAPIGSAEPVYLKQRGKRWKYVLPIYGEQERNMIEETIFGRLFESGLVAIGVHDGKKCFCVTPFGRMSLED